MEIGLTRIVFLVKDNKVGEVLRLLAGVAVVTPEIQPVVNAAVKNGKIKEETSGKMIDLFATWLKKNRKTEIAAEDGRQFCRDIGRSPSSYSYLFDKARDTGLIKKDNKTGAANSKWIVVTK